MIGNGLLSFNSFDKSIFFITTPFMSTKATEATPGLYPGTPRSGTTSLENFVPQIGTTGNRFRGLLTRSPHFKRVRSPPLMWPYQYLYHN